MNTQGFIFEWDSAKERINISKHGIDFKVASQVFLDNMRIERFDKLHSDDEERFRTIGIAQDLLYVLSVVYTSKDNVIRIISARFANRKEIEEYNEYRIL